MRTSKTVTIRTHFKLNCRWTIEVIEVDSLSAYSVSPGEVSMKVLGLSSHYETAKENNPDHQSQAEICMINKAGDYVR